jgi:hypothetical protein
MIILQKMDEKGKFGLNEHGYSLLALCGKPDWNNRE